MPTRLSTQVLLTYATEVVSLVCGLAFGIVTARVLEAAGRGQVAAAWTAFTTSVLIVSLGISKALISKLNERGSLGASDYFGALIVLVPLQALVACTIIYAFFPTLPDAIRGPALAIALIAAPTHLSAEVARCLHRAHRRIWAINVGTLLAALGRVIAILALWLSDQVSVTSVLAVELGALLFSGCIVVVSLRAHLPRPAFANVGPASLTLIGYGLWFQIYSLGISMVTKSNVLILHNIGGDAATGHFAVATRLAEYIGTFTNALQLVFLPFIAQMSSDKARGQFTALVCRSSVLLLIPLAAILALSAPVLVPFLYGESFTGSVAPLQIMAAAVVAATIFQFTGALPVATGKLWPVALISISGLAINLIGTLLLVPRYGAIGAAVSALIAYLCALSFHVAVLKMRNGISISDMLVPRPDEVRALLLKALARLRQAP